MKKTFITALAFSMLLTAAFTAFAAETAAEPKNEAALAIAEITGDTQPAVSADKPKDKAPAEPAKEEAKQAETASVDKIAPAQAEAPIPAPAPASIAVLDGRPIKPSAMQAGDPETEESLLVTPEWLLKNKANVVIVDSRPESLYSGGHIPGAVNASWTYFANMSAPTGSMKYGTIYNHVTMAKRIGALGINGKKTVIAYCDAGGWGQSGWTVWIMRLCGIKNAKILDGGLSGWKKAGGQISRTKHTNKPVAFALKGYKSNYLVNTEWIDNNIGKPGLAIIDVRTKAEYQGKIRPFQEKRAGHLPTAVNIEMENFVTPTYNFREEADIQAILERHGITPDTEIVVYDTAGVRAAFVMLAIRYAGYDKSQCYDEGFQAWAGKADLPIEKSE